jgi:hypothetical protein
MSGLSEPELCCGAPLISSNQPTGALRGIPSNIAATLRRSYLLGAFHVTVTQAIAVATIVTLVIIVGITIAYRIYYGNRARRFGYATRSAYIRAVPRTDEEKREAVDQALKGLVICLVGVGFFPLLLVGIFPLYIGGRKSAFALMGLGLVDESDTPRA